MYGYIGTMRVRPGSREPVVALLLRSVDELRNAGCRSYVVALAADDEQAIVVTEVWESKEHHDASLELPAVKAVIAEAMPMLTGEFTRRETEVVGGLGA